MLTGIIYALLFAGVLALVVRAFRGTARQEAWKRQAMRQRQRFDNDHRLARNRDAVSTAVMWDAIAERDRRWERRAGERRKA